MKISGLNDRPQGSLGSKLILQCSGLFKWEHFVHMRMACLLAPILSLLPLFLVEGRGRKEALIWVRNCHLKGRDSNNNPGKMKWSYGAELTYRQKVRFQVLRSFLGNVLGLLIIGPEHCPIIKRSRIVCPKLPRTYSQSDIFYYPK